MGKALVNIRFDENGLNDLASDKVWAKVGTVNFDNDGLFGGKCAYTRKTGYFTSTNDERLEFGTKDFTISFWIKVLSYAGAGGMGVFGNIFNSYGNFFSTSGGYTQLCTIGVSGSIYRMTDLGLNEWRHVAIVRKDGVFNTYVDGKLQTSNSDHINKAFDLGASKHAILTSAYGTNIGYYPFDGYLDDFVILDYALWTEDFTLPNDYLVNTITDASPNELSIHIGLEIGEKVDLTGYIYPLAPGVNLTQLLWSSDNSSIASVDVNGQVTGIGLGKTKINLNTLDNSWSASVNIIVENADTAGLRLSIILEPAETCKLRAIFKPENSALQTFWTSSDSNIATISATGKVTALAIGNAVITVKTEDNSFSDIIYITVVADKH